VSARLPADRGVTQLPIGFAPRSLLAAQALDHGGDPQLASGVHLRVLPSEQLGLPLAPLLVYRVSLGQGARDAQLRSDIVWRDSAGQALSAPFSVTPENPVTGHLPASASGICCWIEVLADPELALPLLPLTGPRASEIAARFGLAPGLQVTAVISTPLGDAACACASRPAYQLAASRIERVVLTGRGEVRGVNWVDARTLRLSSADLWRVLALPVPSGARYAGVAHADRQARERVERGAPVREPLYEDVAAIDAAATPAATPSAEAERVLGRTSALAGWLDLLINDLALPPQEITTAAEPLLDPGGTARGSASVHALGSTLAAAMDPGVGRWLGLVELDDELAGAAPGEVVAYVIRGFWGTAKGRPIAPAGPGAARSVTALAARSFGTRQSGSACAAFEGLQPPATLPVPFVRGAFTFRSIDGAALTIGDSLPLGAPDGVPELQSDRAGMLVALPYAVGVVEVLAGALNGGGFAVSAYDAAGVELTSVSSQGQGEQTVTVTAEGIAEVAIQPVGEQIPAAGEQIQPGAQIPPAGEQIQPVGAQIPPAGEQAEGLALVWICVPGTPSLPPAGEGPLWDLVTVACATLGNPPDPPASPSLGTPTAGAWMPAPAPSAIREIDTAVASLAPGALLAFARREGTSIAPLNSTDPAGRPLPLLAAPPAPASAPGQGVLHDRAAPAGAVAYRVAQADWFGRWSAWAEAPADPGTRPPPPRPSLLASYEQAPLGSPSPTGTLTGTVRVRVPYPPIGSLPPGANLLDHLDVTVDGVTTTAPAPAGASPDDVEVTAAGPPLARCEQRTIEVSAQWVDSAGVQSVASEAVEVLCVDPRPPSQVTLPETLGYASRPDVTGAARVTLRWATSPEQQRFRIFYTDERTLQAKLGLIGADGSDPRRARAQAIAGSIGEGMSAPDRAAAYLAAGDFFTREWWDQLTKTPLQASGSTASFEHALPGSLRLLSFYRVLAVSAANVDADFTSSPMAAFAVPNTSPPAKPILRMNLDPVAPPGQARLHVRVPPGAVAARRYRLRRSSTTSAEALHMPISGSGTVAQAPAGVLGQELDVIDLGPTNVTKAPLRSWVKYSWRVEVQGPEEPGGGPPGEWSQASDPVSAMLVPADAPAAPTSLALAGTGAGETTVTWQHPDALLGGSAGAYTCEVYRRTPGGREQLAHELPADAPQSAGGRAPDRTGSFSWTDPGPVAPGTSYRVAIVDPIGRRGAPSNEATVP